MKKNSVSLDQIHNKLNLLLKNKGLDVNRADLVNLNIDIDLAKELTIAAAENVSNILSNIV